ncbi:MAG: DNA-binding transcriptional LysR family regulator [Yoonia sp.]|jgi:DNA-binding transcriptional LysR family regulator
MNIELVDLRLFVYIAECENLTRGAEKSFLSPPAASARIKSLEQEAGRQLFLRSNKGVALTDAGEVFLRQARLVLRQVDFLRAEMINPDSGHIRISANTTALTEFLPEILAQFLTDWPGVTVDLQERLTRDIIRSVSDGTSDLGIISGDPKTDNLQVIPFSTDKLVLATALNHPLSNSKDLMFADTLAFEHISLHEGSTLLDFLRQQFRRSGYDKHLRLQVRSFEAMCRLIEAGVGIGVVPESAANRHKTTMDINLLNLCDSWAIRTRSVLVRDRETLPRTVDALIDMLVASSAGGKGLVRED